MQNLGNMGLGIYKLLNYLGKMAIGSDEEKARLVKFWNVVDKAMDNYLNPPADDTTP